MALALGSVGRDGNTDFFLDGAARREFLLLRCRRCATVGGPQEARCAACGSTETEPVAASGRATAVSWSVVHGRRPDGSSGPLGVVAIAQLEEGPWWWSQVVDAGPDDMRPGRALAVDFAAAEGDVTLPVFRLA